MMPYIKRGTSKVLIQNYHYDVFFNTLIKVILFANSIITVRVLGIQRFGKYAFLDSIPLLMSILATFGTTEGLARFIPELKEKNSSYLHILVQRTFVHNLLFSIILLCIFMVFYKYLFVLFKCDEVPTLIICLLSANAFFLTSEKAFLTFLQTNYDNLFLNIVFLAQNIVFIIGFYLVWLLGFLSVSSLIFLTTVTLLFRFVLYSLRYFRLQKISFSLRMPGEITSDFRIYSFKMFLYSLTNYFTSQRGIAYFIQFYFGPAAVGVFRILQRLSDNLKEVLLPRSLNIISASSAIERFSSQGTEELNSFMRKFSELYCFASFGIIIFLLSNIRWILKLYTVDFNNYSIFIILYLSYSFISLSLNILHKYIVIYKKNEFFTLSKIISFFTLVLLSSFFINGNLWTLPLILILMSIQEIAIYHFIIRKYNPGYLKAKEVARPLLYYSITLFIIAYLVVVNVNIVYINSACLLSMLLLLFSDMILEKGIKELVWDVLPFVSPETQHGKNIIKKSNEILG